MIAHVPPIVGETVRAPQRGSVTRDGHIEPHRRQQQARSVNRGIPVSESVADGDRAQITALRPHEHQQSDVVVGRAVVVKDNGNAVALM